MVYQLFKQSVVTLLCGLLVMGSVVANEGFSTPVPVVTPVQSFILMLDPAAQFRQDGMITMSSGERYILIAPETPQPVDTLRVSQTFPENQPAQEKADLLVLNDGHVLLRVTSLSNGRTSFAIPAGIPLAVKTGILPQHFTFPDGFLLPTMWKSLSGNLLLESSATKNPAHSPEVPLLLTDTIHQTVLLWNTSTGEPQQHITLACQPGRVVPSSDGEMLYVGCASEDTLMLYRVANGERLFSLPLPDTASDIVEDTQTSRVLVSHPQLPLISVLDLNILERLLPSALPHVAGSLLLSPKRRQLFAVSLDKPLNTETPGPFKSFNTLSRFFFQPVVKQRPVPVLPWKPTVQFIHPDTLSMAKTIPAFGDVTVFALQDEKRLWMASAATQTLWAFDLRWQERSAEIPLTETPLAMVSDGPWLYLLCPLHHKVKRFDTRTLTWGSPILLDKHKTPYAMNLDNRQQVLYILESGPDPASTGLAVINLKKGQWVGTQQIPDTVAMSMAWLKPVAQTPDEQVRIKFEDGRFRLQNAHETPQAVWPSDRHDPPKTPVRSGP
jgi:hypothetical protein